VSSSEISGETSTAAKLVFRVEGADPDESVDARLALEIPVGPGAADRHRGALNPGHVVILPIEQFNREVVLRGPGGIHSQEHLGPVVGVGTAVTGVDRHEGIAGIVGAGEQRGELQGVEQFLQSVSPDGQIGFERFVFSGKLLECLEILPHGQRLFERLEDGIHSLELGDGGLGLLGIGPEVGLAHRGFEPGGGLLASSPVKESPAAVAVGPGGFRHG
jgi:hypothetical protein